MEAIEPMALFKVNKCLNGENMGIQDLTWVLDRSEKYRYQLLDRMQSDCKYYLGYGNRNPKYLWAGDVEQQIEAMKLIWNSFTAEEKPEWLTWEQIEKYKTDMDAQ